MKDPTIDWLKAVVLERMHAFGITRESTALLADISANTFRGMMNSRTEDWSADNRRAVMKALHIRIADLPDDVQLAIARSL